MPDRVVVEVDEPTKKGLKILAAETGMSLSSLIRPWIDFLLAGGEPDQLPPAPFTLTDPEPEPDPLIEPLPPVVPTATRMQQQCAHPKAARVSLGYTVKCDACGLSGIK